jgi:hypothetical protein
MHCHAFPSRVRNATLPVVTYSRRQRSILSISRRTERLGHEDDWTSDDVLALTGEPPLGVREFVGRNLETFAVAT